MSQTIRVSDGAVEYSWPMTITATDGDDITADTVQVSLGTYSDPATWVTPVITRPTPSSATVKLLIDDTTPVGTYWLWCKVSDSPEVVPRRGARIHIV